MKTLFAEKQQKMSLSVESWLICVLKNLEKTSTHTIRKEIILESLE